MTHAKQTEKDTRAMLTIASDQSEVEAERQHLAGLADKVANSIGTALNGQVRPASFFQMLNGAGPYTFGAGPDGLRYAPGISKIFPDSELEGIIAHEIGHVFERDYEKDCDDIPCQQVEENKADIFAAKHGFGLQLIAALTRMVKINGKIDKKSSHGSDADRIKTITANMPQAKGASA